MINEFSSASSTEWVELVNTDQSSSVSLSGYRFTKGTDTTLKALSGTLPRRGMLTFDLDASSLTDAGDCIMLVDATDTTVYAVSFGQGSCPGGGVHSMSGNPGATQSGALIDGSWQLDDTPTKGWCNDSSGGCPTISTITSALTSEGVTTNLGDMTDFSRTSGLYFEKTGYGKITFSSTINFTDQDALSWMQTLDQKLDMNTMARISLDADLIRNIADTQASLTMYGLSLTNPKIQVDGADDTTGVVSNISYNSSTGTLSFTAAHFTVFTAIEWPSSAPGPASAPGCGDQGPNSAPHLFQINTTKNSATLYFVPAKDPVSYYFIAYGYSDGDERFGTSFNQGSSNGVLNYTVNHLAPNITYYFKIRGGNGCMPGSWSKYLAAKTERASSAIVSTGPQVKGVSNIKNTPTPTPEPEITEVSEPTPQELQRREISEPKLTPEPVKSQESPSFLVKILKFFKNIFGL